MGKITVLWQDVLATDMMYQALRFSKYSPQKESKY